MALWVCGLRDVGGEVVEEDGCELPEMRFVFVDSTDWACVERRRVEKGGEL